ncbi:hypothetical protein NAEGRDRAFT_80600 [Naegleria gruberi]|uniref:Essential protein Yae1 N-terminal domain-containing protein n=1 Tax=Naegleria gruberi TaxID=5762 RepID=D2VN13_NAEGR|nr:uncharacterized protein NAEGRDRAFT_80600 [Naegleria gruberi]EFC41840.1 hypothetical protein NAEGRDRAFT_80600 [Naegleria gruberi]|eukprot:XP_002674584.1 hypothetical protein NAEGRDRAFT_80600 [Naegleria gruberi strain NEG-M]
MEDFDDLMDQVIHLERNLYENAKELGKNHGEQAARDEGFEFGVGYGRKAGLEIGEVIGLCIYIKSHITDVDEKTKERIIHTIQQIEKIITLDINWSNPSKNDLEEIVENLRNKKKLLEIRSKQVIGKVIVTQKQDYSF